MMSQSRFSENTRDYGNFGKFAELANLKTIISLVVVLLANEADFHETAIVKTKMKHSFSNFANNRTSRWLNELLL